MTTYYNFPIAIFRQVRTDNKGAIKHVDDAINDAIRYALFEAYKKLMPPQANPNEYNAGVFEELMREMRFENPDPESELRRMAGVYRKYKNYSVFVGVDSDKFFKFRDNLEYKTDFEIIQLLAFLAIRSIIGAGHYNMRVKHIPWHYVLSRMAGHEKAVSNLDTLPKFISKYASRRLRDKLIKALCDRWHMQYYGKNLGKGRAPLFTFSQSIDLAAIVEREQQQKREGVGKIHADDALSGAIEEIIRGPEPVKETAQPLHPCFGRVVGSNKPENLW
ncbi:MAG: hypothetical protein IK092_01905 [Muribaculaceae bacterium]|nr:hypothetical protein [Muribaculaceae bacterium]